MCIRSGESRHTALSFSRQWLIQIHPDKTSGVDVDAGKEMMAVYRDIFIKQNEV